MKRIYKGIGKSPFVRNIVIIATGTAAAQAITMAVSPIITRIYGPDAYGLLGVFTALVGILSPVAALTYPTAIVLPAKNNEAFGVIRLSLIITFIMSMFVTLILFFFKDIIINSFQLEAIAPFLYLVPLFILFSGLLQIMEQWLIRIKAFKITAKVTFFQAIIIQGSKIGIGTINPTAAILIFITVLGQALKALMLLLGGKNLVAKEKIQSNNEKTSIIELAKKYKDFPIFKAPEVSINALSQSLPILLLTSFFGPASAGFYSIGKTVLNMPSQLIGKSVGDVFYPRISEAANNRETLTGLIKKATYLLGAVGIIPFGIVIIFGPTLFSLVFGAEWGTAGEYARWIALWSFFGFVNRPCVSAIPVLSAQAFHLKFSIFMLITRIAALAVGYYWFSSDLMAIAFFGVSGALLHFCFILITLQISKKFDDRNNERVTM
ncbi:lipopolysaccharide biosynthesis protein [Bacillus sp. JJ1562]|uniref:lipopolysaccharide biosynthesis protein n=1 Tax=Bacillus sp. JJ1562 TaxID=3122960 RepID=UPI0030026DDA